MIKQEESVPLPGMLNYLDPVIQEAELLLRKINRKPMLKDRFIAIGLELLAEGKAVTGEMIFQRLKEQGVRLNNAGRTLLIRIASHHSPKLRDVFEMRVSKFDNLTPDFFE